MKCLRSATKIIALLHHFDLILKETEKKVTLIVPLTSSSNGPNKVQSVKFLMEYYVNLLTRKTFLRCDFVKNGDT